MRRLLVVLTALVMLGALAGVATAAPDKDNPNPPGEEPGCNPSGEQPKKCDPPPPDPDDCEDGLDNDEDGLIDANDPDCQEGGSGDETNDDSPDPCSTGGLLMDETLGQAIWNGGLQIPPLTEDPDADGSLTGPLSKAADGTPLQPVFYEAGCAGDLPIDSSAGGDL